MKFTNDTKLFSIGDEIFPTDFSGFSVITADKVSFLDFEQDSVKAKLNKGKPLIVVSKPYVVFSTMNGLLMSNSKILIKSTLF